MTWRSWALCWALLLYLPLGGCSLNDELRPDPRDPVCGVAVERRTAVVLRFDERRYFFHDEVCRRAFLAHPARYIDPSQYEFYSEP